MKIGNRIKNRKLPSMHIFLLFIMLPFINSCLSPKTASVETIREIKIDIKKTEAKAIKVEKDYRKLVKEKPECQKDEISIGLEDIKTDIYTLRGKIDTTELIMKSDIKRYQTEVRHAKLVNFVMFAGGLGVIAILARFRK